MDSMGRQIEDTQLITRTPQLTDISTSIDAIMSEYNAEPVGCSYRLLDEIHSAIDRIDDYLTKSVSQLDVLLIVRNHFEVVLEHLNDDEGDLDKLWRAPPVQRQTMLAQIYFATVRPMVVGSKKRREAAPTRSLVLEGVTPQLPCLRQGPLAFGIEDKKNTIWCLLIFRMIFWLTLHDFDAHDVQRVGAECLGSLIPVYIE